MSRVGRMDRGEAELSLLWRALGDPTRRRILDLLRQRPRTTGELAAEFPTSRVAVMKHLEQLVDAGVVVAARRGRERWNHLNAVPIERLYRRWVKPYEAHWAAALVRVKEQAERRETMDKQEARVTNVELEIGIDAPAAKVWRALCDDTTLWWRKDFYAAPGTKRMLLEAKLGGRLYEDAGDGAGLVWYTVTGLVPRRSLDLVGHLSAAFGGPAVSMLHLELDEHGHGDKRKTTLRLSDAILGPPADPKEKRDGWLALFSDGLKRHVEAAS
jgi:DNA-binding transcriptional ArsR family regulator